jgi:hypothetical protein
MRREVIKQLDSRLDAMHGAFIEQQLQSVETAVYETKYPELKAREFFPLKTDVHEGAETFAYRISDYFGEAEFIANAGDDLPMVGYKTEKKTGRVETIGNAFGYTVQDLRSAAFAGVGLDAELAKAAMRVHERKVDQTAALGNSSLQFEGGLNHPDVAILSATADWDSATAAQILADLHRMANKIVEDSKGVWVPNTIGLPITKYNLINSKLLDTSGDTGTTILAAFLKTNAFITEVKHWHKLATASDAGGERAICYLKSTEVVQLVIPMEPRMHEPEKRGLKYVRPIESRFGGVIVRQPLAMRYMDGI